MRLDNGLTTIVQTHPGADVAAVQLWVRVGARHETDPESGLSHFIEHLLFKGTPNRAPGEIDRAVSGLGGEMNAATSQDFTYFHVVLPGRYLATALDILSDAGRHAVFEGTELERERLVVLEEIRRAHDNPGASLSRILLREHFAGHPYARPVLGTPETIREASRETIVAYFARHYVPENACVVAIGGGEPSRLRQEVERAFGGWAPRPPVAPREAPVPPVGSRRETHESRPLHQAYLALAWRGPVATDPDVYPADLLAAILGQGRTSRLHQVLRERQGLVSSVAASFYPQHDAGTLSVSARTTAERVDEVEQAVLEETRRMRDDLVTEEELGRARTAVEAAFAFGHETAEGVAYGYGSAETVWTLDFELTYLERVRAVTREAIREVARRWLDGAAFTRASLAPEGQGR